MIDPRAAASPPASQEVHTFYPYFQPSQAAAAIFCALFSIGALVSIWQTFRYKSWIWMVMIIAVLSATEPPRDVGGSPADTVTNSGGDRLRC